MEMKKLEQKHINVISEEEGIGKCQDIGALKYFECSALTQKNIKTIFEEAIRAVLNKAKNKEKPKNKSKCFIL